MIIRCLRLSCYGIFRSGSAQSQTPYNHNEILIFISVAALSTRFGLDQPLDVLEDEITEFQLSTDGELPSFNQEETRLDTFWLAMEVIKVPAGQRFKHLPHLALTALSLPHSNAEPERCFSMVRKVQSDYRSNLSSETLNSLLCVKINSEVECYNYKPSPQELRSAKTACLAYRARCAERDS